MNKLVLLCSVVCILVANIVFAQCPPPGYPPTGDNCPVAPTVCQDLNGYCATLGTNNVNQSFPGCPSNALNNDEWFAFIAGSSFIEIQVVPSNCQGTNGQFGMQGAIYEGSCTGTPIATQCNCTTSTFIMSGAFVPGQVYYVVFDGCAGDICDFQVNVLQGSTVPIPPADPSPIQGPTMVCPGAITNYSLLNANAATFNWSITPPNAGNITGSPGGNISVAWANNFTGTANLCVISSNFVSRDYYILLLFGGLCAMRWSEFLYWYWPKWYPRYASKLPRLRQCCCLPYQPSSGYRYQLGNGNIMCSISADYLRDTVHLVSNHFAYLYRCKLARV